MQILVTLPIDRRLRDRVRTEAAESGQTFADLVNHACTTLLRARTLARELKKERSDAPVSNRPRC